MQSLQKIQTRINSVDKTKKITKAMELVSSAKQKKARAFLNSIEEYTNEIDTVYKKIYSQLSKTNTETKLKRTIYVAITSDLGLCGAYNQNVTKMIKELVTKDDKIIIIGLKGNILLKQIFKEDQILKTYSQIKNDISLEVVQSVKKKIVKAFDKNEFDEVVIVYTQFINTVTVQATAKKIFPLDAEELSGIQIENNEIEFEPSKEVVIKQLFPLYIGANILSTLSESKLSEVSARMSAMQNATNNAEELNKYLKLVFNKSRQSNITQEITEIISGNSN